MLAIWATCLHVARAACPPEFPLLNDTTEINFCCRSTGCNEEDSIMDVIDGDNMETTLCYPASEERPCCTNIVVFGDFVICTSKQDFQAISAQFPIDCEAQMTSVTTTFLGVNTSYAINCFPPADDGLSEAIITVIVLLSLIAATGAAGVYLIFCMG